MSALFDYLFEAAAFVPHGVCLLWRPDLVALHAASDISIAAAYLVIPVAILAFVRRRSDLGRTAKRTALLFALFIVFCALTHISSAVTIWYPAYGAQGLIKAATALISVTTAVLVWPLFSRLQAVPSFAALETANRRLEEANVGLETALSEQTHLLDAINERVASALKGSNITLFEQDTDLRYRWIINPRLGQTPSQVVGRTDKEILPDPVSEQVTDLKLGVMRTGESASLVVKVPSEDEGLLSLELSAHPTRNLYGSIDGVICSAVDLSERYLFETRLKQLNEALLASNKRFELALENSFITVFEQDRNLEYTYMHNPPPGTDITDYLQKTDAQLFQSETSQILTAAKNRVMETGEREHFEITVEISSESRTYDLLLEPRHEDNGSEAHGIVGTAIDVTERRKSEDQMRVVMRELTHRSKNLLAVIQAMARQTAARADDMESFLGSFSARLRAMATSHDLLVNHSWHGAEIGELVAAHLAQVVDTSSGRLGIEGPTIRVNAETSQQLGLALHELATNAAKYGSLSTPSGLVSITWAQKDGTVRIYWRETGGPAVHQPERKGFGSVLLERSVGQSLGGSVSIDYQSDGLTCEIQFPDSRLAA